MAGVAAQPDHGVPVLGFRDRFGAEAVRRLRLEPGESVLDVGCGTGGMTLPAARAVAPAGRVVALDPDESLLELVGRRAADEGLTQVVIRRSELAATALATGGFDAVVCGFQVGLATDPAALTAELVRLTRPNGRFGVSTWGTGVFEPASSMFWGVVRSVAPELYRPTPPWQRFTDPDALRSLLTVGGVAAVSVEYVAGTHPLRRTGEFWDIVLGSGYRATVDALGDQQRQVVRELVLGRLHRVGISSVATDVLYATARRAPG